MNMEEMGRTLIRLRSVLPQWAPKEIDRDLVNVWINVLKDYSDNEIRSAFLRASETLTSWPVPATIKRLCEGCNKTDDENGQEIASRIEGAVGKLGYCYESDPDRIKAAEDRLRSIIGDMGMEVVKLVGGWNKICRSLDDESALVSARKQWRELATSVSKNFFTKGENLPPALPEKKNPVLQEALRIAIGGSQK